MRSHLPKVMHKLAGQPMIQHVLNAVSPLHPEKIVIVLAEHMNSVKNAVSDTAPRCFFAVQDHQLGTGHAVRCAQPSLNEYKGMVLVLYGDTPMIRSATLSELLNQHQQQQATISLLGMQPHPPTGYGRLVMRDNGHVERIVECKDATAEEKLLPWVWAGVMAFDSEFLWAALSELAPSAITGEYYLTSLVEMASTRNFLTIMVPVDVEESMGINDRVQLSHAENVIQQRLRDKAMREGATMIDPESVYLSADTKLGRDVIIYPSVVFGPGVSVEDNVEIRSFSHIEGAHICNNAIIGPYARLRPGSIIGEGAHVGNFVELKKSTLGKGAKANHLSYIGDAKIGAGSNIGAGTITCNYDGANKYDTVLGENVFIGSNTSLVAPIIIGDGAIIGAGSVITQDVDAGALAIARAMQINKSGKAKAMRQRQKKA